MLSSQWILILHLVVGVFGIVSVAAFLARHWWARRHAVGQRRNARWGYLALACLLTLLVTGVALMVWTNVALLQWLYWGAMIVLVIDLSFHMAWRERHAACASRYASWRAQEWRRIRCTSRRASMTPKVD